MYTSFQNLENCLEHRKDYIGLAVMCFLYYQIKKNNLRFYGVLFFLQTSDIYFFQIFAKFWHILKLLKMFPIVETRGTTFRKITVQVWTLYLKNCGRRCILSNDWTKWPGNHEKLTTQRNWQPCWQFFFFSEKM